MVGCTVACTFAFAGLIGTRFETLALTLSPGGLAEMSLIALALGVDVAIISTMHVLRIAIVVLLAPQFLLLRSEEHTSELQSLMRISYAVFCLKKKNKNT